MVRCGDDPTLDEPSRDGHEAKDASVCHEWRQQRHGHASETVTGDSKYGWAALKISMEQTRLSHVCGKSTWKGPGMFDSPATGQSTGSLASPQCIQLPTNNVFQARCCARGELS